MTARHNHPLTTVQGVNWATWPALGSAATDTYPDGRDGFAPGEGGQVQSALASDTADAKLVCVVGILSTDVAAATTITVGTHDGTPLFAVVTRDADEWIPFGSQGILLPYGFSYQSSVAGTVFSIMYRKIA